MDTILTKSKPSSADNLPRWYYKAEAEAYREVTVEAAQLQRRGLAGTAAQPEFRGAALSLQSFRGRECIISGPSETGKTWAALYLLDSLARAHPKMQGAILRKVHRDLYSTVIKDYRTLFETNGVTAYGGNKPEWFDYPNGARIYCGGLDRPGAFLSGALDVVYLNQAEESELEDWETLTTRTTGRAGVIVPGLTLGDCNPSYPQHWILHRPTLKVMHSRHEDNPRLYTADGQITEQGTQTMTTLDALTGARLQRLRHGLWVQAEGTVYEFNPAVHEIDPFPIPADWRRVAVIDFGYTNPFVCQWWAIDPDDRMILYREIYMTGRTVRVHAGQMLALSEGENVEAFISDHDAEDRATLEESGIFTIAADKDVTPGIQTVQERLKLRGDGKPGLMLMRGALVERDETLAAAHKPLCTRDEFDVYSYPKDVSGHALKEIPVKLHDHGMDATRYGVRYLSSAGGWTHL